MVVAMGAAGVALRGAGGAGGDGVTSVPPAGHDAATTSPPSPSSPSTSTSTGPADLPACTAAGIDVVPTGEGATAQAALYAEITVAGGGQPCRIDTRATFGLRDPATDEVLAIEGNPQEVVLSGTVDATGSDVDQGSLVLSGCLPGDGFDDRSEVTIELVLEGYGTYRGTAPGSRCVEEGSGAVFGGLGGPPD
jgi:hypothetical protein